MSSRRVLAIAASAVACLLLLAVADAEACAVCFGNPDSPLSKGMQKGILVLLGCIGTVLAGFASLFFFWMWRVRQLRLNHNGVLTR